MRTTNATRAGTVLCAAIMAAACDAHADVARPPSKPPVAATSTPEAHARAVLDQQVKALPSNHAAFLSTFAPDAVVMLPRVAAKLEPDMEICGQITDLSPHAAMRSAKVKQVVAGGDASMGWLAAEIEIVVISAEPEEKQMTRTRLVRAVELLDAASDWKVVAASFTDGRTLSRLSSSLGPIPSETQPGPLVKLLTSPDALAAALGSDAVVYGTDAGERAVGASTGKTLLAKWRKLPLVLEEADKVREVHGSGWGFAMADVNLAKPGGPPYRMSAFVVATPKPDGTWQVNVASYGSL